MIGNLIEDPKEGPEKHKIGMEKKPRKEQNQGRRIQKALIRVLQIPEDKSSLIDLRKTKGQETEIDIMIGIRETMLIDQLITIGGMTLREILSNILEGEGQNLRHTAGKAVILKFLLTNRKMREKDKKGGNKEEILIARLISQYQMTSFKSNRLGLVTKS